MSEDGKSSIEGQPPVPWHRRPIPTGTVVAILEAVLYYATGLNMPWWFTCFILFLMWALLATVAIRSEWTVNWSWIAKGFSCVGAALFVITLGAKTVREQFNQTSTVAPTAQPTSTELAAPAFPEDIQVLTLTFGNNTFDFTGPMLKRLSSTGIRVVGGRSIFSLPIHPIYLKANNGKLYVSVTVYPGLRIEWNHVKEEPPQWDCITKDDVLECIDEQGVPMFQLVLQSPSHLIIRGIFPFLTDSNVLWLATDNQGISITSDKLKNYKQIKPIFKHPRYKYHGEYAEP